MQAGGRRARGRHLKLGRWRQEWSSRHSQNHSMAGVGRALCGSPSPAPCRSRVTHSRLHRTTPPCRGEACTPPQGSKEGPGQEADAHSTALRLSCIHSQVHHRTRALRTHHTAQTPFLPGVRSTSEPPPQSERAALGQMVPHHVSRRDSEQDRLHQGIGSKLTFLKAPSSNTSSAATLLSRHSG